MVIKKYISKKVALRLAFFIAVVGVAFMFDVHFENNPGELNEAQSESAGKSGEQGKMYFVNHSATFAAKGSAQKNTGRKLQVKLHDRFIQKYHQQRNYQVLKAEVQTQSTPLILSYHYLVFKNYFFTSPDDDDPLVA